MVVRLRSAVFSRVSCPVRQRVEFVELLLGTGDTESSTAAAIANAKGSADCL